MALSTFFTTLLLPSTSPLSLPKTSSLRSRSRSRCSPVIAATASPPSLTASSATSSVCESDISSWMAIAYPAMAYSTTLYFKPGYFNVEVIPNDNEPEDRLIHRFRKEVLKAGVLQECRRRRFFENEQEKKKRKARDASRKNRKCFFKKRLMIRCSLRQLLGYDFWERKAKNEEEVRKLGLLLPWEQIIKEGIDNGDNVLFEVIHSP